MGFATIFCLLLSLVATSYCDVCGGVPLPQIMDQDDMGCISPSSINRRPTFIRYAEGEICKLLIVGCESLDITDGNLCMLGYPNHPMDYINGNFAAYIPGNPMSVVTKVRCRQ